MARMLETWNPPIEVPVWHSLLRTGSLLWLSDRQVEDIICLLEALRLGTPRPLSAGESIPLLVQDLAECHAELELFSDEAQFPEEPYVLLRTARRSLRRAIQEIGWSSTVPQGSREWKIPRTLARTALSEQTYDALDRLCALAAAAAMEDGTGRKVQNPSALTALGSICDMDYLAGQLKAVASLESAKRAALLRWAAELGDQVKTLAASWSWARTDSEGSEGDDITEEWPVPGRREEE